MLEEGGPLIQDDRCPQRQGKFGDTHTHTHTPYEDEGRNWGDACKPRTTKTASKPPEA